MQIKDPATLTDRIPYQSHGSRVAKAALAALGVVGVLAVGGVAPTAARADLGVTPGTFLAKTHSLIPLAGPCTGVNDCPVDVDAIRAAPPVTQAGAHPDASTAVDLIVDVDQRFKDIAVDTPPGFIGDPTAVPTCSRQDFATGFDSESGGCPPSTQVGVATTPNQINPTGNTSPVYNLPAPRGVPALFGLAVAGEPILLTAEVRTDGDYGLEVIARDIFSKAQPLGTRVTLWGVPADPVYDPDRWDPDAREWGASSGVPVRPFLINPTSCDSGPLPTTIKLDTWEHVGSWLPDIFAPDDPRRDDYVDVSPEPTGCEKLRFGGAGAPVTFTMQPTSHRAATPSGFEATLRLPYNDDPNGLANPTLKDSEVVLPEGVAVNPSAAAGLGACTTEQIGLRGTDFPEPHPVRFTAEAPRCPDSSKVGTMSITTPLLEEPLEGAVYLAAQNDNPFESLLAIYLVIDDRERGLTIKLAGEVTPDPETGQLTATFLNNPQLPFTELELHFFGGPRASLVNPPTCGTHTTTATWTPWSHPHSGPPAQTTDSFEITQGPDGEPCPATLADRPFDPELSAGSVNPLAGTTTPFVLRLTRQDGEQEILSTQVTPPEGLTAKLAGIPLCTDANAAAGSCGPESRVGAAITGAGAGPNPFYITNGEVFLAGPYEGAPLSLVIEVPAVAGPFDLGTVVVRAAVHVDPRTAQLTVISDPIPQILEGIPLRVKDIRILVDRPGFTTTPTSCEETQVAVTAHGSHGATANLSDRYQVGGCEALGFSPKFGFKAKEGRRATKRNFHPTLEATVSYPPSQYDENGTPQANIDRVAVTLPKGVFLDQDNLATICTRAQFAADECPEVTKVGDAEATTPLLDEPLSGPVYLIASDNKLPDIVADLNGIVDIDLYGRVDQSKRRIRNTFEVVPDAPVSHFRLTIDGGKNEGLLVNSRNTCRRPAYRRVNVRVFAHNGATAHQRTQVRAPCKANKRKLRRKARRLRRKAQRLERRGHEAQAKKVMRRALRVAKRAASTRR